jgi:hypothetical protein
MNNNKFKSIFTLVFFALGIASCNLITNTEDEKGDGDNGGIAYFSIDDAVALYIAEPGTVGGSSVSVSATNDRNVLFKITDNGYVQEVTQTNDGGTEVTTTNEPDAVFDVNPTYVIVRFGSEEGYLVRKTDGAAFELNSAGVPNTRSDVFDNTPPVQTDSIGNLYYLFYDSAEAGSKVLRIDVSDPDNLTAETYAQEQQDAISGFVVSPAGHVAYNFDGAGANRIQKANGGIVNLPGHIWLPFWVGLDGSIKYNYNESAGSVEYMIYTVSIEPDGTVSTTSQAGVGLHQGIGATLFQLQSRTVAIETLSNRAFELENPSNSAREISLSELADIKLADASDSYVYVSGLNSTNDPVLLRMDPVSDEV